MDGTLYYFALLVIALIAFQLNRTNNTILMLIVLSIGAYIIYVHETGHTATDFKNEMVESLDESTRGYEKEQESEGLDLKQTVEEMDELE